MSITKRPRVGSVYRFEPSIWDRIDANPYTPKTGALVRTIKSPHGCPPFGVMNHGYVEDFETGAFCGLVALASLRPVYRGPGGEWLAAVEKGVTA